MDRFFRALTVFLVTAAVLTALVAMAWGVASGQVDVGHGPSPVHVAPQDEPPDYQYP